MKQMSINVFLDLLSIKISCQQNINQKHQETLEKDVDHTNMSPFLVEKMEEKDV